MSKQTPTIVWFRQDLRLRDNSALAQAIEAESPIIPVFIWAPHEADSWAPGAASKWWLHQSLKSLNASLVKHSGAGLIIKSGDSLKTLRELIAETGASRVFWNRRYQGALRKVDAEVKRELRDDGIEVESFNSSLLNEPHTVSTGSGNPYKVYTPYWKKVKDRNIEPPIVPDLKAIRSPQKIPESDTLESLELLPQIKWYTTIEKLWTVSEEAAMLRLDNFLENAVTNYHEDRDRPDYEGTSSMAAYLHWGQIGPRQIVAKLKDACSLTQKGPQTYLKEIYWREFAYNVLYHFPKTPDEPLRAEYSDFPWKKDPEILKAWQKGRTGYPIVDAGMRQLWETGTMHNRVRMIVSSLLVKHLLQDWHDGAKWFWDTLLDADLASNTLGWQWSGGCGADAAPYFRIFNPITQGQKFDPEGNYVKKFVPELKDLSSDYIHEPWTAPKSQLDASNIEMGKDYPYPIIEHKKGRQRALEALDIFKSK